MALATMDRDLNILERQALSVALAGAEAWLAELREQVQHLRVVSRKYTGFGFFTDFVCEGCLPASGLPSPGSPLRVPVAWAAHPDVENGGSGAVCFNVFLKEGVIVCLEGASTSTWPATEELITFAG
jgi:hypothetical protein